MLQLHVETAGKEALKWVAEGKVLPDLILLDCMMPGMSGTPLHIMPKRTARRVLYVYGRTRCAENIYQYPYTHVYGEKASLTWKLTVH